MTTDRTVKSLVALAAAALLVTGCVTGSEGEAPETSTPAPSTSVTTSETTEPSPEPTTEVVPEPAPEPAPEAAPAHAVAPAPAYTPPTFVQCYLADGSALMSDGSHIYVESCDESAGGPYLLEDGTSIYDHVPLEAWDGTEWEGTGPPPGY